MPILYVRSESHKTTETAVENRLPPDVADLDGVPLNIREGIKLIHENRHRVTNAMTLVTDLVNATINDGREMIYELVAFAGITAIQTKSCSCCPYGQQTRILL